MILLRTEPDFRFLSQHFPAKSRIPYLMLGPAHIRLVLNRQEHLKHEGYRSLVLQPEAPWFSLTPIARRLYFIRVKGGVMC